VALYSGIKSNTEKNNLHYFSFFPNFEKTIKAAVRHLPPDTPAEDISSSLEGLGFNVNNVGQMTATRTALNGRTHVEPLPLFLVALTK
jgi:hypothetical protein